MILRHGLIELSNVFIEDIFSWFYDSIMNECGDGCGAIVCKNYKMAADLFIQWFISTKQKDRFWHPKSIIDEHTISFHDNNENFIFTDDIDIQLYDYDNVFIIKKPCCLAKNSNIVLVPV